MTKSSPRGNVARRRGCSPASGGPRSGGPLLASVLAVGALGGLGWFGLDRVAMSEGYVIVQARVAEGRLHPVQHVGGRIDQVHAVVGKPVAAGELLATVDPGDVDARIAALKAEALASQLRLEAVRREVHAFDVLQEQRLVARERVVALEQELAQLEKENASVLARIAEADSRLALVEIRSPISGVVHSMNGLVAGRDVRAGAILAEIAGNPGGLVLEAVLSEGQAGDAMSGRHVRIWPERTAWHDGRAFAGRIVSLSRWASASLSRPSSIVVHVARIEVDTQQAAGLQAAISRHGGVTQVAIPTGTTSAMQQLLEPFRRKAQVKSSHQYSSGV